MPRRAASPAPSRPPAASKKRNFPQLMTLREACFIAHFALLLHDSWAHPETPTQATTWGLVLHTLAFGCSGRLKTLLAAPALFYAHGVLAGWLLFTYHNPQLDRQDKVDNWGCSLEYALVRTVLAHVMPLAAHWAVARSEIAEHRAAHGSFWALLFRGVVPSFLIFVTYGLFNIGALGIPGLEWLPKMTENYNARDITEQELTDQQTVCLIVAHLVALGAFHRAVKKPATKAKPKRK